MAIKASAFSVKVMGANGTKHTQKYFATAREAAHAASKLTRSSGRGYAQVVDHANGGNGRVVMECKSDRSHAGKPIARCHFYDKAFKTKAKR